MRRSLLLVVCALVVLAGATPAQGTTFTGTGEYAVGPRPSHLAMGDLDGDGAPDLVVANNGVQPDGTDAPGFNTVSVLLGAPGGTFAPAVPYTVGDNPAFVTVVDLDGDAAPDIAVTSLGSQTLSILLGNGDGTFAPAVDYDAGPRPRGVASGDFDGDGDPDLAVANRDGARTTVLLGNGDGTFGAPVGYDTGGSGPALVVVADVNNDGQADLAVTNQVGNNVAVLVGNGDGTFDPAVTYPSGGGAFGLAAGHLDADGHLDLVTADYLGDGISVLLGNGDGSFDPPVAYPVGSSPFSVATADVNGDGELDVIAANQGSQINSYVVVFLGNGDGTLASGVEFPTPAGPTVIAGDLDADGRPDIATANGQADSVSVLLNQAQAATTTNLVASAASSTYGQEASFTATVSGHDIEGHAPGGTVTFFDGTTVVGTAGVSSGTATLTTSALAGGSHQITARYDGDPNFASSTSTAVVHAVDPAATTTAVTSSPNPSTAGDAVTFTATISGTAAAEADATGAVTFLDGGTSLGSAPLSSGVASLSLSSLAPGDHAITAVYGGDANFSASTSAPSTHVVVSRVPASREDCLNGGWRTMTDDEGNPFPSQGACVSFVSRGSNAGRNR